MLKHLLLFGCPTLGKSLEFSYDRDLQNPIGKPDCTALHCPVPYVLVSVSFSLSQMTKTVFLFASVS